MVVDSSAICAYLEKIQPAPPLYPSDPYDYARAIWFEEFADTGLLAGAVVFFQQRVLQPLFFKKPGDEALVEKAASETLPPLFDYLERELGGNDYLVGGRFTIADAMYFPVLTRFRTYGIELPRALAGYAEALESQPAVRALIAVAATAPRIPVYDDYLRRFGGDPDAALHAKK